MNWTATPRFPVADRRRSRQQRVRLAAQEFDRPSAAGDRQLHPGGARGLSHRCAGGCQWLEVFNSDAECYGGSNTGNGGGMLAEPVESHGEKVSLSLTLPPLGVLVMRPQV